MRTKLAFILGTLCALSPGMLYAATTSDRETELTAFTEFDTQGLATPETDSEAVIGPRTSFFEAEALVSGFAPPFPGQPNSVGTGFASAAGDSFGNFGVGVNASFGPSARPEPHSMLASGTHTQTVLNDTDESLTFSASGFIPAPVIVLAGQIGNFFPPGVDPALDVAAEVLARIILTLERANGDETQVLFEYGMKTGRNALGELGVTTTPGAPAPTVIEDVGFFSFALPETSFDFGAIGPVAPGETVTFDFQYFATGGTGFGETAVFAAIGDPFNLTSGGGRVEFTQEHVIAPPIAPVPLPGAFASLAIALSALAFARRRRT